MAKCRTDDEVKLDSMRVRCGLAGVYLVLLLVMMRYGMVGDTWLSDVIFQAWGF